MDKNERPWSMPVAVEEIPETGLHLEIDAPADIRAAVAALAGLRDLPRLSAVFDLSRRGAGVHVAGRLSARVGQTCVVTLDPIENDIEETVDLEYAPGLAETAQIQAKDVKADEESPELLMDGTVDVGAIATEFLLLGIDPYPRKAGAEFAAVRTDDGSARPFAALEALKKRLGGS